MERKNKIIFAETIIIISLIATNLFSYHNNEQFIEYVKNVTISKKIVIDHLVLGINNNYQWIINQEYDFSLNNRELASIILLLIFSAYVIKDKKVRKATLGVFKVLKSKTAIKILMQITIYTILITLLLYNINIWNTLLLKDSIIWYFFTASFLTYSAIDNNRNEKVYSNIIFGTFKITALFQFFQNLYPFHLLLELILLLLTIIIVLMKTTIESGISKDDTKLVMKILDAILTLIGMIYIIKIVISTFQFKSEILNLVTLKSFILPIIYNLLFLPYIMYVVLFSLYEEIIIFLRLNKNLSKFQRMKFHLRFITKSNLNRNRMILFIKKSKSNLLSIQNTEEIDKIIETI